MAEDEFLIKPCLVATTPDKDGGDGVQEGLVEGPASAEPPCVTTQPDAKDSTEPDCQPTVITKKGRRLVAEAKAKPLRILGILQVICGICLLSVNIAAICLGTYIPYASSGIAGGILAVVAGGLGIAASKQLTRKSVNKFLCLSIVATIAAACVIGFSACAIEDDRGYAFFVATEEHVPHGTYEHVYNWKTGVTERKYGYYALKRPAALVLDCVSCALGAVEIIIAFVAFSLSCGTLYCSRRVREGEQSGDVSLAEKRLESQSSMTPSSTTQLAVQCGPVGANCTINCFCPTDGGRVECE